MNKLFGKKLLQRAVKFIDEPWLKQRIDSLLWTLSLDRSEPIEPIEDTFEMHWNDWFERNKGYLEMCSDAGLMGGYRSAFYAGWQLQKTIKGNKDG